MNNMKKQIPLIPEILKLSVSKNWDVAKTEWKIIDMEEVEEPETCLCGHFPIIEVFELKNKHNNEIARIGNVCVNKFIIKNKNFDGFKKIKKNIEKSINTDLLEFAYKYFWIGKKDYDFYLDIMNKRKLSEKQLKWKKDINQRIINRVNNRTLLPNEETNE